VAPFSRRALFGVEVLSGAGHVVVGYPDLSARIVKLLVVPPGNHLRWVKGWGHPISPPRFTFVTRKTLDQSRGRPPHRINGMSIVKINAITVPRERFDEFAERFASRAGKVEEAEGFEAFELLRPNDDRDVCLVLTRWRSEDDFQAWLKSADFAAGHSQHRERGPVGTTSEIWSFDLLEAKNSA
jgi:heme oxygenase (mycobilin-producing)